MDKESGRVLECIDLQWSSRPEHAWTDTYASTGVHSNAPESPHSEPLARDNASRSYDRTKYNAVRHMQLANNSGITRATNGRDKTARHRQYEAFIS